MEELQNNLPQENSNADIHVKGVVESLLFVNEKSITLDQLKDVLEVVSLEDIKSALHELREEYDNQKSGMTIVEISNGYQMLSSSKYKDYIRKFYKTKHKEKLSKPALESLAIIAYKQPVTRADVEAIRGVNSDGVVNHLLHKELIRVVGRKEVAGRPFLYAVTKQFLEYFGLKSLEDLPTLEEFPMLAGNVNMDLKEDDDIDQEGDDLSGEKEFENDTETLDVSQDQPEEFPQPKEIDETVADEYLQENRNIREPDHVTEGEPLHPDVVLDDAEEVLRDSEAIESVEKKDMLENEESVNHDEQYEDSADMKEIDDESQEPLNES